MDIKTISEAVFSILLPFFKKSKSLQQISTDIGKATDTSIADMWTKVKPIFIEEFDEEKTGQLSDDIEDKGAVAYVLKKTLKKDESLQNILVQFLEKKDSVGVVIKDSSNVIQGSTLSVERDAHIGDNTTNTAIGQQIHNTGNIDKQINIGGDNYGTINIQQVLAGSKETPPEESNSAAVQQIQDAIAKNNIKQALETLLRKTKGLDSHNSVILLTGRWNRLKSSMHSGIIDHSSASVEQNKILAALLYLVGEL